MLFTPNKAPYLATFWEVIVHNFERIRQRTFSNVVETFVQLAFVEAKKLVLIYVCKDICYSKFFEESPKYVSNATVHSSN